MRLNQFLAASTDLSRRSADQAVADGRVEINGLPARLGDIVVEGDIVMLDGETIKPAAIKTTIVMHKPAGIVVSRHGQGSRTIYDVLPPDYHNLNPIGRLDKDSSGLLVLTNDGDLHHKLSHPSFEKQKIYEVLLNKPLDVVDHDQIEHKGVALEDGPSRLKLSPLDNRHQKWLVTMHEGRNRQIRRTFAALGYKVVTLHRTHFGPFKLGTIEAGDHKLADGL